MVAESVLLLYFRLKYLWKECIYTHTHRYMWHLCVRNRNDTKFSVIFYQDNGSALMKMLLPMLYFQMADAHIFLSSLP